MKIRQACLLDITIKHYYVFVNPERCKFLENFNRPSCREKDRSAREACILLQFVPAVFSLFLLRSSSCIPSTAKSNQRPRATTRGWCNKPCRGPRVRPGEKRGSEAHTPVGAVERKQRGKLLQRSTFAQLDCVLVSEYMRACVRAYARHTGRKCLLHISMYDCHQELKFWMRI